MFTCEYCGGKFNHKENYYAHLRWEKKTGLIGQLGEDFVVCGICGVRLPKLNAHLRLSHGMDWEHYKDTYPGPHFAANVKKRQAQAASISNKFLPGERVADKPCEFCGDMVNHRQENWNLHLPVCKQTIKSMVEGIDFVTCPECHLRFSSIAKHLRNPHGFTEDKIAQMVGEGVKLVCDKVHEKRKKTCLSKYGTEHHWQNEAVKKKRRQTWQKNYGVDNPFANAEVKERIHQVSLEKYGVDHPMQNAEVFSKQQASAQNGPSGQEVFFNEHTCDNIVFSGFGGLFVHTKTGVNKFGRLINNFCPDFILLPDDVATKAQERSHLGQRFDEAWRSAYVVELLGDYYHSKEITGVVAEQHAREIREAYASVGIDCLLLWEHQVLQEWELIRPLVEAWIQLGLKTMQERTERHSTSVKVVEVDRRKATFVCPYGSGERFKTLEQLDAWKVSEKNLYRPGLEAGRDYIVCLECGRRFLRLGRHLRSEHGIVPEDYLAKWKDARLICDCESQRIGETNSGHS